MNEGLTPGENDVRRAINKLSPEQRRELDKELADDSEKERLRKSMDAHLRRQREIRDSRLECSPEVQAAHQAWLQRLQTEKRPKYDKTPVAPFVHRFSLRTPWLTVRFSRAKEARREFHTWNQEGRVWRLWIGRFVVTLMPSLRKILRVNRASHS